jgi:hypothetical protein
LVRVLRNVAGGRAPEVQEIWRAGCKKRPLPVSQPLKASILLMREEP